VTKPVLVLKFGGTSMADAKRIRQVAAIVRRKRASGYGIIVVVSARARQTDVFIEEARSFSANPAPREMDMLLSSGERISAALLAIALNAERCDAVALSGSQAGIITDDNHTNARIIEVRPYRVLEALKEDCVAIVGGFQGVSFKKEITTLGRGGSDVTAVALASALGAERCEIYSDVDGVFSADPNVVPAARRLDELSYQEMQEMGEAGARVLHPGSVEFAKIRDTIIHAKCTWSPEGAGSIIRNLEGRIKPRVVGVASEEKVVLLQLTQEHANDETLRHCLELCQTENLRTKQLTFHPGPRGELCGNLVVPEKENYHIDSVLNRLRADFASALHIFRNYSAVSVIGTGITDRYEYIQECLALLQGSAIPVAGIHTSSFRISLILDRSHLAESVRLFHKHFIEDRETLVSG
jgi:aspartate kinase